MNGMEIAETAASIQVLLNQTAAANGITATEFLALRIIAIQGDITSVQLHDYLSDQFLFGLAADNSGAIPAALEERGLIAGAAKGSTGPVVMTEAGKKIFDSIAVDIIAVSEKLYSAVDMADLITATKVILTLQAKARELAVA